MSGLVTLRLVYVTTCIFQILTVTLVILTTFFWCWPINSWKQNSSIAWKHWETVTLWCTVISVKTWIPNLPVHCYSVILHCIVQVSSVVWDKGVGLRQYYPGQDRCEHIDRNEVAQDDISEHCITSAVVFIAANKATHPGGSACGEDTVCALLPPTLWHSQQVCSHVSL